MKTTTTALIVLAAWILLLVLFTGCDSDGDDTDTAPYCETNLCWQVEPTNQTACWNEIGIIDCTSFPCDADGGPDFCGQDAQYEDSPRDFGCLDMEGAPQDSCSATADDGEAVVDSLTGLTWQRTWSSKRTWQQAVDYCGSLADQHYGGLSNWRLPGYHELAGLLDHGQDQYPSIDQTAFPGTPPEWFWTSASYIGDLGEYWAVSFGEDNWLIKTEDATEELRVRCVSGEPYHGTGANRFLVEESVVSDQATGLSWTRCNAWHWKEALARCEMMDRNGVDDWHLPNAKEVLSLIDIGLTDPASDFPGLPTSTGDPMSDSYHFWTSTSSDPATDEIRLFVSVLNGGLFKSFDDTEMTNCICVRGGL